MLRIAAAFAALVTVAPSLAVNVVIDYTYAPSFFSPSTNNGRQARETVEAAAEFFSAILDDSLAPISTPAPFVGQISTEIWSWNISFPNPVGSGQRRIDNPSIAADEYRIFVGAHSLGSGVLGQGSFGISGQSRTFQGAGLYTQSELGAINAIDSSFSSIRTSRGEASGFVSWGGTLKFNSGQPWHYDHDTAPTSGRHDLFTTALHEMGHALGFGTSTAFRNLVSGDRFTGAKARAANGGQNPRLQTGGFHWRDNDSSLRSPRLVGGGLQDPAMDPTQTLGQRKVFTELDAAALDDIGWDVVSPAVSLPGDFNGDGRIDAIDYTVWRDDRGSTTDYNTWNAGYGSAARASAAIVPEPAACLLASIALVVGATQRGRQENG